MDMRTLLKALMALRDENAYGLESRSSVPQATINRLLTGKHGDPRPPTFRKLAGAYGLTESQLRGDAPLPEPLARQIDRLVSGWADGLLPSRPIAKPAAVLHNRPMHKKNKARRATWCGCAGMAKREWARGQKTATSEWNCCLRGLQRGTARC